MTAVGVPEMTPVEASITRPAGRVGDMDQEMTVPPKEEGVADGMVESLVRVNGFPL